MRKNIDSIFITIGGWAMVVFLFVVLIPLRLISAGIGWLGGITRIKAIQKIGAMVGIGISYMVIDIVDITLGCDPGEEEKRSLQKSKDINEMYIEVLKSKL